MSPARVAACATDAGRSGRPSSLARDAVASERSSAVRDAERRPVQCCDCRQAELTAAFTADVVKLVVALEPALATSAITEAVLKAAPSRVERKWLVEHLAAHPEALTSRTGAPRVVCQFAAALIAVGAASTLSPCCDVCGKASTSLANVEGTGRACEDCMSKRRAEPCARCGRLRRIWTRLPGGAPICSACAAKEPARLSECTGCGRRRVVNARTEDGGALCGTCYRSPADPCTSCGDTTSIVWRRDGAVLCSRCYVRHQRQRRQCGGCGRMRIINRRGDGETPDLCNACHWAVVAICTRCGVEAPGRGESKGEHVCLQCLANQQVDELIAGPDGVIAPSLLGVREAFHASETPRARHSAGSTRVLEPFCSGGWPLARSSSTTPPRTRSNKRRRCATSDSFWSLREHCPSGTRTWLRSNVTSARRRPPSTTRTTPSCCSAMACGRCSAASDSAQRRTYVVHEVGPAMLRPGRLLPALASRQRPCLAHVLPARPRPFVGRRRGPT